MTSLLFYQCHNTTQDRDIWMNHDLHVLVVFNPIRKITFLITSHKAIEWIPV